MKSASPWEENGAMGDAWMGYEIVVVEAPLNVVDNGVEF